jgi:hypothetical protein
MATMDEALADLPAVELTAAQRHHVLDGRALPQFQVPGWSRLQPSEPVRLRDSRGLLALGRVEEGRLRPFRVLREAGRT